jgi:hypothetical protein
MSEPRNIFSAPELLGTLDMSRPVGLTQIAMVHFADDETAYRVMRQTVDALAAGGYLAASVATDDLVPDALAWVQETYRAHGETVIFRTRAQVERFFDGLQLRGAGCRTTPQAHPLDVEEIDDADIAVYGAVARKR